LDHVRNVLRRKHYSIRTEQSYVDWIRRFILFDAKRHPAQMGKAEVTAFLTYLATQRNVAALRKINIVTIPGEPVSMRLSGDDYSWPRRWRT
jgi:hypothetical protein